MSDEERQVIWDRKLAERAAYARTPEGRRELAIDTMASWRLEGMEPSPEALEGIRDYVEGRVTVYEAIARVKATAAARMRADDGTVSAG